MPQLSVSCIIIDHFLHLNRDWSPFFSRCRLSKNGWQWVKTARNLNIGVSRNRFCDFLADPDSRSFSRFGAIIMQFAVSVSCSDDVPPFIHATPRLDVVRFASVY
jgi:hypothetical protein